jgi:hypothetical protein
VKIKPRTLLLCLACVGCSAAKQPEEVPEFARARVEVAGLAALEADRHGLTIAVSPTEVVLLDGATLYADPTLELVRADPRRAEAHRIVALHDAMLAKVEANPALETALLIVDPQVETGVLIDVLYTAGKAGMTSYGFAVSTDEGPRVLTIRAPRACEPGSGGFECLRPVFMLARDGVFPRVSPAQRDLACSLAGPRRRGLSDQEGRCPLPRGDFDAMAALLDALPRMADACPTATITAENDIAWAELAELAAWLQGPRGLAPLVLEAWVSAPECSDVLRAGDTLQPGAFTSLAH